MTSPGETHALDISGYISRAALRRKKRPGASGAPPAGHSGAPVQSGVKSKSTASSPPKATGGGGGSRPAAPASVAPATVAPAPVAVESRNRPPLAAKTGMASGAQAAVVKVASHASGRARIGALLDYQSHKGELVLEREDGTRTEGREAVRALALEWGGEAATREPSKDTLHFIYGIDRTLAAPDAQRLLGDALEGHKYSWRIETGGGTATVHVVMAAAGSGRDDDGKRQRYFANGREMDRLNDRLDSVFSAGGRMSEPTWKHGVEGAIRHLTHLTHGGEHAAATQSGKLLKSHDDILKEARSWRREMRSQDQRDVAHIIMSSKPGTDREAFLSAARATLAVEFPGREYAFVLHTNRNHLHVHAAVKMAGQYGERMHPNIKDLERWRETLAHKARERNIPMETLRRGETANPPAYTQADIKSCQRGNPSEGARRRVEGMTNKDIPVPRREEARKRVNEAATQWHSIAAAAPDHAAAPPAGDNVLRLYRAETPGDQNHRAPLFTSSRSDAILDRTARGGIVTWLDIPRGPQMDRLAMPARTPGLYIVNSDLARARRELPRVDPRLAGEFAERTGTAAAFAALPEGRDELQTLLPKYVSNLKDARAMDEQQEIVKAARSLHALLDQAEQMLPADKRPEFQTLAKPMRRQADENLQFVAGREAESQKPRLTGDKAVDPTLAPIEGFAAHFDKGAVVYQIVDCRDEAHHARTAFTDTGRHLQIALDTDKAVVREALKLAARKWETVAIQGGEAYKDLAIQIAVANGIRIANPELAERIETERNRQALDVEMQTRKPAPGQAPPSDGKTGEEREIDLQRLAARAADEARLEAREARRPGSGRTDGEAAAAAHAARDMADAPHKSTQAEPGRSPETGRIAGKHDKIVETQEQSRRRLPDHVEMGRQAMQRDAENRQSQTDGEGQEQ